MPINVTIHSIIKDLSRYTPEDHYANVLADRFRKEFEPFPKATGNIAIYTNITYGGGETSESDILIVADLDNYSIHTSHSTVPVSVQKGCWVLELKTHDISSVKLVGNQFFAPYSDQHGGIYEKPISVQSRKQRFDIKNFFTRILGYSPWIDNFLCFTSISEYDLSTLKFDYSNIDPDICVLGLSHDFTFEQLVGYTITYRPDSVKKDSANTLAWFNSCSIRTMYSDIERLFTARKQIVGAITQQKMAILSIEEARKSTSFKPNTMNVISGRAGTGKTMRLLQLAVDFEDKGNRCLVLTYNHALVADTRRLLFLTGHHAKLTGKTIDIRTLHSFFIHLMIQLGVRNDNIDNEYYFNDENGFAKDIKSLKEKIDTLPSDQLAMYRTIPDCEMNWDYIMIDEGQDWDLAEVYILSKLYGKEHIVFADGVDQFIRSVNKINIRDISSDIEAKSYTRCLRQKNNLVQFVNAFAEECNIAGWRVESSGNLLGGRVYVTTMDKYDSTYHSELLKYCKQTNADAYDMLALVPPQDVKQLDDNGEKQFAFRNAFQSANIKYFDGTMRSNRTRYSIVGDEMRLYQYESCRGLEGWITICFDFDLLIEEKKRQFDQMGLYHNDAGASIDEQRNYFAFLWALMPLTRAVDRLVIVLRDRNGEVAKHLENITAIPGFDGIIEWK